MIMLEGELPNGLYGRSDESADDGHSTLDIWLGRGKPILCLEGDCCKIKIQESGRTEQRGMYLVGVYVVD